MRQGGNRYLEHEARAAPYVLYYAAKLIRDGLALPPPVNLPWRLSVRRKG